MQASIAGKLSLARRMIIRARHIMMQVMKASGGSRATHRRKESIIVFNASIDILLSLRRVFEKYQYHPDILSLTAVYF